MTGSLLIRSGSGLSRLAIAAFFCLLVSTLITTGCYNHSRGNPVDKHHYEHSITVVSDYSNLTIHTYLNRSHLRVGHRLESLYDGNRDGELTAEGIDRVQITDYIEVEAEENRAERITGEIRNYDQLFRDIISAVKAGDKVFVHENRKYELKIIS